MNHNIIDEKTNVVCYGPGYIACVKTSRYVMSLGIGTRSKEGEELLELSSKLGEKKYCIFCY